jgi:ABC-type glycerol-3-phosphate transport system substrate-binding protein
MMLRRLVLLSAALAVIPACGASPTAPALDANALMADKANAGPVTTSTTTTTTTTDDETGSPKDGEGRGGGFVGSGS